MRWEKLICVVGDATVAEDSSVLVPYSGELEEHIRIHMCKKTKQEEGGKRASKERSGNKYAKRSGLRPFVRPLRKSSGPIEPLVPRSFIRS